VLYSAVPLPVDLADAMTNPAEPADVSELVPDAVEANITSTLDQLDGLVADDDTPGLSATVSTEPLLGNDSSDQIDDSTDPYLVTSTPDTPVAATIVMAVAPSPSDGSMQSISEGDILQLQESSIRSLGNGLAGQEIIVRSVGNGGTLYQNGVELVADASVSLTALEEGNVLFIPDLNYSGTVDVVFAQTEDSGGDDLAPESYTVEITVAEVADDGIAVVGDSLTPINGITPSGRRLRCSLRKAWRIH